MKVATFFYSSNLAFRQVESSTFKELMKELRPTATRQGTRHCNRRIHTNYHQQQQRKSANFAFRWLVKLDEQSPLIASSICIGNAPFLLSADECGSEKKRLNTLQAVDRY